jgi:hypothetical protein
LVYKNKASNSIAALLKNRDMNLFSVLQNVNWLLRDIIRSQTPSEIGDRLPERYGKAASAVNT